MSRDIDVAATVYCYTTEDEKREIGEGIARALLASPICKHGKRFDVHCNRCQLEGFCGCPKCEEGDHA